MTHSKDISEKNKFLNRHLIKCPRLETFFKTQNMSMNKYLFIQKFKVLKKNHDFLALGENPHWSIIIF